MVTVRVATHVALPFVPDLLGGGASFGLDAEHRVPIGQYQEPGEVGARDPRPAADERARRRS